MKPILSYIGGKSRMAKLFAVLVPDECEIYIEPFAGLGAVAMSIPNNTKLLLNDKSRGIATLWKVMRDRPVELMRCILRINVNSSLFDELKKIQGTPKKGQVFNEYDNLQVDIEDKKLQQIIKKLGIDLSDKLGVELFIAMSTFVIIALSFDNNRLNMKYKNRSEMWGAMTVELHKEARRIPEISRKLRMMHAQIDNAGLDSWVWNELDNKNAFYYVDPPYVKELLNKSRKDLYLQAFSDDEQRQMLNMIKNASAKVVLSGYRGGTFLYDQYLNQDNGWHCYLIKGNANKSSSKEDKRPNAQEFIWTNFEVPLNATHYFNICPIDVTQTERMYWAQYYKNKIK